MLPSQAVKIMYDNKIQNMLPDLEKKDTVNALFFRLNPLLTFIDYELLEHLISEFGSQNLKHDMSSYVRGLKLFKKEATVGDLIGDWPGDVIAHEGGNYKELMAKFEGDPNNYTLENLDNFRLNYFSKLRLSEFISVIILECVKETKSFYAVWRIPAVIAPDIIEAARHVESSFYVKEAVVMVSLDTKVLYPHVLETLYSASQFPKVFKTTTKITSAARQQQEQVIQKSLSALQLQLPLGDSETRPASPSPLSRSSSLPSKRLSPPVLRPRYSLQPRRRPSPPPLHLQSSFRSSCVPPQQSRSLSLPEIDSTLPKLMSLPLTLQYKSQYKVDSMSTDNDGNTFVHAAAFGGSMTILGEHIAKYNRPENCCHLTPLHLACSKGNVNDVRMLVTKHKADLNARDAYGNTPLRIATICRQAEVINCLIQEFKCNPVTVDCQSILRLACHQDNIQLAETMLAQYKVDPMSTDNDGNTFVHVAALGGSTRVLSMLITKYGCRVDCRNNNKQTPLHLACSKGNLGVVRMLVSKYKANLNARGQDNNTPVHTAAWCGKSEVVTCLVEEFKLEPDIKRLDGKSILHLACCQGYTELAEALLIDYDLDLMSIDNDGNTPLHDAALTGVEKIVKLLISKYNCPIDCRNNTNQTPLHLACSKGHCGVVRLLVQAYKADLSAFNKDGNTPLHIAALSGQTKVIDFLVKELHCNPIIQARGGRTILHLASQHGHLELVEEIVTQYKLDPLSGDDTGNTSLHYAALGGKQDIASVLITYGCPVDIKNSKNETPLHLACSKGHLGLIRTLLTQHKADLNARNENNDTPLHTASLYEQTDVIYCLIIDLHCDPNIVGFKDRNILHHACFNDHDMLARLLIDIFHFSIISGDIDGNTPLHLAAMLGRNKCVQMLLNVYHAPVFLRNISGKSALEVSTNSRIRTIINDHLKRVRPTIQHDYKQLQALSTKKYSGAQRLTRIFVMGNPESGKSTLIESMKREGFFSSLRPVSEATVPPHTSGIIPSIHYSKTMGRVLFYDFAGYPEYYLSHSTIFSNVMQSKEGTNVCLILVNFQKDMTCILEEIGYWLNFINTASLEDQVRVLVLGSHVDRINGTEATNKVEVVSKFLANSPYLQRLKMLNKCLILNCRKPRSAKLVQTMLLQRIENAKVYRLSMEATVLLGLLEKDFKNAVTCSLQTILDHIAETGICLPTMAKSLYPIVRELHTFGLLMLIERECDEPENSLLILNVTRLTNEVHKVLFSMISTHSPSMGVLPGRYLTSFLPEYISTECLVQLQYCQEISHAEVKFNSVIPTNDSSTPTLLYFPSFCKLERKNIETPDCFDYSLSWYVQCIRQFDYLSPRFVRYLLLRLGYSFALPSQYFKTAEECSTSTIELYNHRCTMWKHGIHWFMQEGIECFVEIVNNSKGIVVITKSIESQKSICTEMLFKIVREIQEAKDEFCATVTLQQYLMDSIDPASFSNEDNLFALSDIQHTWKDNNIMVTSVNGRRQLDITEIIGMTSFIQYGK